MNKTETEQILDYLKHINATVDGLDGKVNGLDAKIGSTPGKPPLSDRVDTIGDKVDAQFARIDARFNRVDRKIDGLRDELVDHMERLHDELAGRIVDLETPPGGGAGGSVAAS
jgi:uncharacterized protein YdcH (DUF465 family)